MKRLAPFVSVFGILASLLACGAPPPPLHEEIVCAASDSSGTACDANARRSALAVWWSEASSRPGSTLSLWIAGDKRDSAHRTTVCVPEEWSGDVSDAKAELLDVALGLVAGTDPTKAPAETSGDCPTSIPAPAKTVWLHDGPARATPGTSVSRMVVVCDRSDSTLGIGCSPEGIRGAFDHWLEASGGASGASFRVTVVGTSRDSATMRAGYEVTGASPAERLARSLGTRRELESLDLGTAKGGSAIAEALSAAVYDARTSRGPLEIRIHSDMRQVTPGQWNFERRVPRPDEFVAWLRRKDLLVPELHDAKVLVCGEHTGRGPGARSFDATMQRETTEAWRAAFGAMGVTPADSSGCAAR